MSNSRSLKDQDQDPSDAAKEREFYKYYEPFHNVSKFHPREDDEKYASWDTALSAFAQLGALRLNCRRALISFFDRQSQFVLAEATPSLSLYDDKPGQPDDELWLGAQIVERRGTVCEYTIVENSKYQPGADEGEEIGEWNVSLSVIPDLTKHEIFKDQSHVKGAPYHRFYAGIPIQSPSGFPIGAFTVYDDKPRDGLSEQEEQFMRHMAAVIMEHMDGVRAKEEHRRAEQMVRGLGAYVEGKSSMEDWWMTPYEHQKGVEPKAQNKTLEERHPQSIERQSMGMTPTMTPMRDEAEQQNRPELLEQPGNTQSDERQQQKETIQAFENNAHKDNEDLASHALSANVKATFSRAAEVIRQAIEVDGVVCYDAAIGSFGGLVDVDQTYRDEASVTEGSATEISSPEHSPDRRGTEQSENSGGPADKHCGVLGWAIKDRNSLKGGSVPAPYDTMSERFLHSLLQRHARGKIFNFDPGEPRLESSHPRANEDLPEDFSQQVHPPEPPEKDPRKRRAKRAERRNDLRRLQALFPKAKSLALIPMWDAHRKRWFAGVVAWSELPFRLLHMDSELSFLAAFGHSIMAEVARLDTVRADKAKADVLSNISHELRSPLHGILGGIECLQDTSVDAFQENLIRTIETCGKTLLDTINHLLDFAKINHFGKNSKATSAQRSSSRPGSDKRAPPSQLLALESDVDLAAITEQAVETVFAGFDHWTQSNHVDRKPLKHIEIYLDVAKEVGVDWNFRVEAGAWRRIVMNLCGNSLKYTQEGFVRVKLDARPLDPASRNGKQCHIQLTVTDSGKGMSQDYLNTRLFQPFAQEDPLQPGTGLGLSIVRQIIESMGGKIFVDSAPGRGTEIRVQLPMDHAAPPERPQTPSLLAITAQHCATMKVGFIRSDEDMDIDLDASDTGSGSRSKGESQQLFIATFQKLFRDWYGIDMDVKTTPEDSQSDFFIMKAETLLRSQKTLEHRDGDNADTAQGNFRKAPLIVLCDNNAQARRLIKSNATSQLGNIVDYVPQPYGPQKMARAIAACLERLTGRKLLGNATAPSSPEDVEMASAVGDSNREATSTPSEGGVGQNLEDLNISMGSPPADEEINVVDTTMRKNPLPDQSKIEQAPPVDRSTTPTQTKPEEEAPRKKLPTPPLKRSLSRTLNVLLVDDNKINLNLLATYMKKNKHSFATAVDGEEAVEVYKSGTSGDASTPSDGSPKSQPSVRPGLDRYDYVFMDISMPKMDGLEATRYIRQHERANGIKPTTVIALTGLASASVQQEAYSSGIDLFLTKPIKMKELTRILEGNMSDGGAGGGGGGGS